MKFHKCDKGGAENFMSSFINDKYDSVAVVRVFILKKVQKGTRLKELNVPIADNFYSSPSHYLF